MVWKNRDVDGAPSVRLHCPTYSESSSCYSSSGEMSPATPLRPDSPDGSFPTPTYQSLAEKIRRRVDSGDHFFSLEFFPPRTKNGAVNLLTRIERMSHGKPLFCDITWHNGGNPGGDTETSSMAIAGATLNYCGLNTMLHLTCCGMTQADVTRHLRKARDLGIRNILALRGDIIEGKDLPGKQGGFSNAIDLVQHIRKMFGDYFIIGVAGYPHGHPECPSYDEDLQYLKAKLDAGADFVITQLFFKAERFLKYVDDCRRIGITVPIIPGVMPIQSYDSLRHIVKLSKVDIPAEVLEIVHSLKDNDEAICNYGISQMTDMIHELFRAGDRIPGIHVYTLNREFATVAILRRVGLWHENVRRSLPWKVAANSRRCSEDVRPIFWSTRPKSYIYRTQNWDEFPNGRWGSSESPAFGELKDYYLFFMKSKSPTDELLRMWGEELKCEQDVFNVFARYISGEPNEKNIKVTRIPWNDDSLNPETSALQGELISVNKRGVLTINSQPRVNGAPSGDPVVGWGHPGGYVYQKAYLEFFTCRENVNALREVLPRFPSVNYHIINNKGDEDTNCHKHRPIAVTWGVFPGREIIQPTVVDPVSFKVWKDEAFALWKKQWGQLYPEGSMSHHMIEHICDEYFLVNLVDNDFVYESCLFNLVEAMFEQRNRTEWNGQTSIEAETPSEIDNRLNGIETGMATIAI